MMGPVWVRLNILDSCLLSDQGSLLVLVGQITCDWGVKFFCLEFAVYALTQLWDAWGENTPDPLQNLAGWNHNVSKDPPCAQTSPWKGVFCNAKRISKYGVDAWAFEIMGL